MHSNSSSDSDYDNDDFIVEIFDENDFSPGYHDLTDNTWHKQKGFKESRIYRLLGNHSRILPVVEDREDEIMFPYLDNGDMWSFLLCNKSNPSYAPLTTCLTWAIEIAQGIAHLHANNVIWADAHMGNMLFTDDFHIVLCDFGFGVLDAKFYHSFKMVPPLVFACPRLYYGIEPTCIDIFGFAVTLFALLEHRFPFTDNVSPNLESQHNVFRKYNDLEFDQLRDPIMNTYFGQLLNDCFHANISRGDQLVRALVNAFTEWFKETGQVIEPGVPYPQEPEILALSLVPPMIRKGHGWSK
ncbi:hypothetical protein VKT23_019162 [Stygiomarasmius scandens]|uniref:Protein kinase domain-containing protein n=1 Tax=Marasmiellus scandens TaxID=2682957 RepID=A0ABR1IMD1_9AGAR